jgi:hypothetical protein
MLEVPAGINEPERWVNSIGTGLGNTMASDDKKTKTEPAPKTDVPSTDKSTAADTSKPETGKSTAADTSKPEAGKSTAADTSKPEGGNSADAVPYSRGEGQKPVSQAYRDNWNAIFARKKKG